MKTIFLTGISRGIGSEIFKLLCNTYYFIGTTRKKINFYEKFPEAKSKSNIQILELDFNIYENEKWNEYIERILLNIGSIQSNIDIFVNNSGVAHFKPFEDININDLKSEYFVNTITPTIILKSVIQKMIKQKNGLIINISSIATKKTFTNASIYSASKNSFIGLTNSIREEVRKYNIKVVNLFLGATNTEIWDTKTRVEQSQLMIKPENVAKAVQEILLMSELDDLMIEEITIKPQNGDL